MDRRLIIVFIIFSSDGWVKGRTITLSNLRASFQVIELFDKFKMLPVVCKDFRQLITKSIKKKFIVHERLDLHQRLGPRRKGDRMQNCQKHT